MKKTINWNNYLATKPQPFGTGENKINLWLYSLKRGKKQEKCAYNFLPNKKAYDTCMSI